MKFNVHYFPSELPGVLLLIFDELVSLGDESLDPLPQPRVADVLLKLLGDLIRIFYIFYLFALLGLVQVILEHHHTLRTSLLGYHKLISVYLFVILILFLLSLLRKIKPHAL